MIAAAALAFAIVAPVGSVPARAAESVERFLVPGVDFSKLTFKTGAWCRYIVVDEALEQTDTSEIYIGVPGREETPQGAAFWVEIETRHVGEGPEATEVLSLLVLEEITRFSEGDSVGRYVSGLYIKSGTRPAREEDPKNYGDLSLVIPTADSSWVTTTDELVGTASGEYSCTKKSRTVKTDKEIPTGNVKLIKKARDDYTVWFCDDIPVFHMVKCVIERERHTETVPRIPGIPATGAKNSSTVAELHSFGFDAKPIITMESSSP
jgi:hypothetical protein